MRTFGSFASALLLSAAGCVPPRTPDPGLRLLAPGQAAAADEEVLPDGLDARGVVHALVDARSRGRRVALASLPDGAREWLDSNREAVEDGVPASPASIGRWRFLRRGDVVYAVLLRMEDELFLPATLMIPTAAFQPRPGTAPRILGHPKGIAGITRDFVAGRLDCELAPELALKPSRAPAIVLAIDLDLR